MAEHGIKELMEVLDALEVIALSANRIMKDDKVNAADLPEVGALAMQASVLVKAFDGVAKVADEVQEIDTEEGQQVLKKFFDISKKCQEARS